jgi:phosphate transport system substrate-binding protein
MVVLSLFTSQKSLVVAAAMSVGLLVGTGCAYAQVSVDEQMPSYLPVSDVSGDLNSVGSDTLNNLMTYWAESFKTQYPNVKIQIEGKGSNTAPPALTEGTAQLGPMSREMKPSELDAFEKKYGYKPTSFKVAIDALAVFVHKDNPIKGLNLQQIDGIYSSTLKRGGKNIATWDEAGLADWAGKPISLYGRNSDSGTYLYFKEHALSRGDYKNTVKEQIGSSSVVQAVENDINGIGYSGIGYLTSGVKALAIAVKDQDFVAPTFENALSGTYPLSRFLYIYINKKPNEPIDPLVGEFIKFIESKNGQELVVKDGYFPLPIAVVKGQISKLVGN